MTVALIVVIPLFIILAILLCICICCRMRLNKVEPNKTAIEADAEAEEKVQETELRNPQDKPAPVIPTLKIAESRNSIPREVFYGNTGTGMGTEPATVQGSYVDTERAQTDRI